VRRPARPDLAAAELAGADRRTARSGGAADPPELGKIKNATNAKAKRLLGWSPRSNEDCIVATAESLMRLQLLKDSRKAAA